MRRSVLVAVLVATLAVASIAGVGLAQEQQYIRGEPGLEVHLPDDTIEPGSVEELSLQVSNEGEVQSGSPQQRELVTTARNVRVEAEADDDGPIAVETGRQAIGSVTENQPVEVPVAVRVPEGAEPGTYTLEVELEYAYTTQFAPNSGVIQERTRTVTRDVEVEVDDGAQFELRTVDADVQVGDTGTLVAEIENAGDEPAREVDVTLESRSPRVAFGEASTDTERVDRIEPGETERLEYDVGLAADASVRNYSLDGTVEFTDPDGIRNVDEDPSLSFRPLGDQTFAVENAESTLRVGEEGELRGAVRNDGSVTARSVVVRLAEEDPNVFPLEQEVAVGTLEPGESDSFALPIEIGDEARAVPKSFDLAVTYRNADDEQRSYEDLVADVEIGERRDEFAVTVEDREIGAGETRLIDVEVTNNLDERVTDVEAQLFADDPLDSGDDEGYVEALDPGESTTMTFSLSADGSAVAKTYPASMDFRYDDEDGTSTVSDTYRFAVDVTEDDDGGPSALLLVGVALVLVVVGGAGYWATRRRA